MRHTLYICYFGLREPLVQTQVIPYLRELAKGGMRVSLLTFEPELHEKWLPDEIDAEKQAMAESSIEWECLAYHKRPSAVATAFDIFVGAQFISQKIRTNGVDVLHGRSHVATLMGALARKLSPAKPKLIFDIRGFLPEEYADAGVWRENGMIFRAAKRVEKWLMRDSDAFVVLTEKARSILFGTKPPEEFGYAAETGQPVEVIPCCVDFEHRFPAEIGPQAIEIATRLNLQDRFVITHIGALGGLYLTGELVDFLTAAKTVDPSIFALILTQTDPSHIISLLLGNGFARDDFFVSKVQPNEIPAYLNVADAGLSFVKATYATQSRSPTKIPEYLAAGLPIIANSGVGDVDDLIKREGVGILIDRFDRSAYIAAFERLKLLGDIGEKCRETAKTRFDLETVGGLRYRRLYERLFCNDGR